MPDIKFRRAAKFWTGLVGVSLVAATTVIDSPILTGAIAVVTAWSIYMVPNEPADTAPQDGE